METGRVILITGGSGGIGSVLARSFSRQGYRVVIHYLHGEDRAKALEQEIGNRHGRENVMKVRADVASRAEVCAMFDQIAGRFGGVDILVNNAGINRDKPFLQMTDAEWSEVIGTILTGSFICSQEFALRYQGSSGSIVNIGAITGISGRKNGANYCSARAGILMLTKCLAMELAPRIRVNCVTPGFIETGEVAERYELSKKENLERVLSAIPLGTLGQPEDLFTMIHYLVDEPRYITGQNFMVDGGRFMH